jgi:hypothetical protein
MVECIRVDPDTQLKFLLPGCGNGLELQTIGHFEICRRDPEFHRASAVLAPYGTPKVSFQSLHDRNGFLGLALAPRAFRCSRPNLWLPRSRTWLTACRLVESTIDTVGVPNWLS